MGNVRKCTVAGFFWVCSYEFFHQPHRSCDKQSSAAKTWIVVVGRLIGLLWSLRATIEGIFTVLDALWTRLGKPH